MHLIKLTRDTSNPIYVNADFIKTIEEMKKATCIYFTGDRDPAWVQEKPSEIAALINGQAPTH